MSEVQLPKGKRGRPTKKNLPGMSAKIMDLAKEGKTNGQIAEIVGISERTLDYWKSMDWEFAALLKQNKAIADELVEASLFKRATGYTHTYETEKPTKDGPVTVMETMHCPPDPTSMIFWLKNRRPEDWREKQESEFKSVQVLQVITSRGTQTDFDV